jgi:hypothetical protein
MTPIVGRHDVSMMVLAALEESATVERRSDDDTLS